MNPWIVALSYTLITSMMYNCKKTQISNLNIQPPNYIFGLVWPIIFILLYFASIDSTNENNIKYYLLVFSFMLWPLSYVCFDNKFLGIFAILISLMLALMLNNDSIFVAPVIAWLIYALILNCFEVERN